MEQQIGKLSPLLELGQDFNINFRTNRYNGHHVVSVLEVYIDFDT